MWLTKSSVGRKVIMSLTGLFLILFVTFHVLMNAVAIISPEGYNAVCHFLGANWYALAGTLVLAAGFLIHILYSFVVSYQNKKARGNDAYAENKRPKQVEWASQNMLVLGLIILCFLVVHLIQFWYRMQYQEIMGTEFVANGVAIHPADGAAFLNYAFKDWWTLAIYLVGFAALWFHMSHGFWSSLQSLGVNNNVWMSRLRTISIGWATVVCLLFAVEAVVFFARANCPNAQCPLAATEQVNCNNNCNDCDAPCEKSNTSCSENACEDACN